MRLFDLRCAHVVGGTSCTRDGVDVACAAATVGSGAGLFAVFGGIAEDARFFGHGWGCCCWSERESNGECDECGVWRRWWWWWWWCCLSLLFTEDGYSY